MFSIYHIPTFVNKDGSIGKIGCTHQIPQERVLQQGYSDFETLETHKDIYIASNRERELQKEYGYPVDTIPYYISYENMSKGRTLESCSKGGKANSVEEMKRKRSLVKVVGTPPKTPILVFKNNELLKEYPSISECARDMKLDKGNIQKVCKGINKQHKGYVFKYKDSTQ